MDYAALAQQMFDTVVSLMSSKTGALVGEGQDLALVLFLMSATWLVLMWMLSSDGSQALVESVTLTMKFSIVFSVMLLGWSSVGGFFQSNTNEISRKVAGTSTVGQGVLQIARATDRLFVSNRQSIAVNCSELPTYDLNGVATGGTHVSLFLRRGWLLFHHHRFVKIGQMHFRAIGADAVAEARRAAPGDTSPTKE